MYFYLDYYKFQGNWESFWETAHLPSPKPTSLRAKRCLRGGVGGQFPETYHDPKKGSKMTSTLFLSILE